MARLTVERKDFGKNTLIINHLSINLNMLYYIFKKKQPSKTEILFSGDSF